MRIIHIRNAAPVQRAFIEAIMDTPLYHRALQTGLSNIYRWCVARALEDVYMLDIQPSPHYGDTHDRQLYYDQVSRQMQQILSNEFYTARLFIGRTVAIKHHLDDLIIHTTT